MSTARVNRSPASLNAGGGGVINAPIRNPGILPAPPPIEASLISYLENVFKPTVEKDKTLRDYDRSAGHLEVIDHLKAVLKEQTT